MTQEINIPGYDTLNPRSAQLMIKMILEDAWDVDTRVEVQTYDDEARGHIYFYPAGPDSARRLLTMMADAGFIPLDGKPEYGHPVKMVVDLDHRAEFLDYIATRDN